MERYVAFLRGINVGGHRVTSAELRAHVDALDGIAGAATYRTSGNVIFEAERADAAVLEARLEEGLTRALGYAVPVFVRSADELRAIAANEPFDAGLVAATAGRLQVMLLSRPPAAAARDAVLALATDADRLAIRARELYWLPSGGILDSALDLKAIDAALGRATVRTKNTIDLIAAKFCAG